MLMCWLNKYYYYYYYNYYYLFIFINGLTVYFLCFNIKRIESNEIQGQVKTSPLMPNLNSTLNYRPSSSIEIVILWYFRV